VTETHTISPTYTATLTGTPTYTVTITLTGTASRTATCTGTPTVTETQGIKPAARGGSYACPQPASTELYIVYSLDEDAPDVKISIFNAAGMPVADIKTAGWAYPAVNRTKIDLAKFSPGIYYYLMKAVTVSGKTVNFSVNKFMVSK
jgi:hypothetical protein